MAKQVVALEASFDTSAAEGSVKSLKAQMREAQAEVSKMADKFGETSVQAANAAKKAAELKDKIGDAKALMEAFNPDKKFQAFSSALSGVAGGFSAVQGAMGLMGAESKDLEKTMLKVQSAMALSQGLSAITEAQDSFKNLKTVAVDAFKGIKAAIGSTGIGLLVIALATIYAYWDDIKAAVSGVSEEQQKLNVKTKANLDAEKEKLKNIGSQDNILKLQGKSERFILDLKIKQIDAVIKATEASIVNAKITKDAQIEAAKRNKDILEGVLKFISAPITVILKGIDLIGKAVGKNFGLEEKFFGGIAKLVFNPEETKVQGDKTIKEQQDALTQLKNDKAGFQLQIQAIDKSASDKTKADKEKADKEAEAVKKEQEQKEKERLANQIAQNKATDELILRNRIQSIKDEFDKKQFELAVQHQKEIDAQLELVNNGLLSKEEYEKNKLLIDANYKQQEKDLLDAHHIEIDKKILDANEKKAAADKKAKDDEIAREKAVAQAKKDIEEATFNVLEGGVRLIASLDQKNKGLQKAALIAESAIGIAKIIINTKTANSVAAASPLNLVDPTYGARMSILNTISSVIGIGANIAATAKGLSALGGGGGASGGGGGVGGATPAPVQPQVQSTTLNQGQVNQMSSATSRAFVLESDVSGNQERIQRLNRAARIN